MKYLSWPRRHKWLSLLILLAIIALGVVVYQKVALELNRRAFQQAGHAIETIYTNIVREIGPPDNNSHTSECSRPSVEFGEGPLSCGLATHFIYGVANKEEADRLKKQIQDVIDKHPNLLFSRSPPKSFIDISPAPTNNTDSTINYYKTQAGMDCTAKYTYDMPREIQLSVKDASKKGFGISIGCSSDPREQFFPLHQPS